MCFRPAGVQVDLFCPYCGKKLMVVGNTVLKKCPFCKEVFTEQDIQNFQDTLLNAANGAEDEDDAPAAAPATPGAPAAPAAPGAPAAPAAPKAPGAPM